jgi:hypothetical protein
MQSIDIRLKPSKTVVFLSIFLWLGSVIAVMSLNIANWITLPLIVAISLYGINILFLHGLLIGSKALKRLQYISGNHWQILMNQGECTGILMGDSTVTLKFCILRFQIPGKKYKYSCLIVNDSVEFDTYRRLLLRLRCFIAA